MRAFLISVVAVALVAPAARADAPSFMKRVCAQAVMKKYGSSLARIDMGPIKPGAGSFALDGTATLTDGTTKPFHCDFRQAPTGNQRPAGARNV